MSNGKLESPFTFTVDGAMLSSNALEMISSAEWGVHYGPEHLVIAGLNHLADMLPEM